MKEVLNWGMAGFAIFAFVVTIGSWIKSKDMRKPTLIAIAMTVVACLGLFALDVPPKDIVILAVIYWIAFAPCMVLVFAFAHGFKVAPGGLRVAIAVGFLLPAVLAWTLRYSSGGYVEDCHPSYDKQGVYSDC